MYEKGASILKNCYKRVKNLVQQKSKTSLMELFLETRSFKRISLDLHITLIKIKNGLQYAMIIFDRYKKQTQVLPLRRIDEYLVSVFIYNHWVIKNGVPREVI